MKVVKPTDSYLLIADVYGEFDYLEWHCALNTTETCDFEWKYANSEEGDAIFIPVLENTVVEFKLDIIKQTQFGQL